MSVNGVEICFRADTFFIRTSVGWSLENCVAGFLTDRGRLFL